MVITGHLYKKHIFLETRFQQLLCNALALCLEAPWIQSHGMASVPLVLLLSSNVLKPNTLNRVFSTLQLLCGILLFKQ
jgi:hypothetical protein